MQPPSNNANEAQRGSVLIVDDTPENLEVLSMMLGRSGLKVRPARSGELALRSIDSALPDLILLDIRMPEMDGYEVCRRLKENERTREIPVIFISALHNTDDKIRAFRSGGVDYIVKPFQIEEVLARVDTQIELSRTRRSLEQAYAEMEQRVEERTRELSVAREAESRTAHQLQRSLVKTIEVIAIALEKRDPSTAGHQKRVSRLAGLIAERMGRSESERQGICLGGLVHDIGKIYVPAEILSRPGRLSEAEMALVRTHPEVGYEILKGVEFPWPVAQMVLQHQERLDGSGYPAGLKGEEILPEACILAVADVVEAMSSHRPYRPARGLDAALNELRNGRGVHYAADAVDAAIAVCSEPGFSIEG